MNRFLRENGRGILLIVATYFYFLIFAQFAFIELLDADLSGALKPAMAAMALCGIAGSLGTPFLLARLGGLRVLALALIGCALMATLAIPAHQFVAYLLVSMGTGLSLGMLTVALTAQLPSLLGRSSWGLGIGVGTGLAYACANLPPVFVTSPQTQAVISAAAALAGLLALGGKPSNDDEIPASPKSRLSFFPFAVLVFLALVWLDSAAFFIIQHTSELKESSWAEAYLWRNGVVHFLFAVLAGWWVQSRPAGVVTLTAFVILALASLCLNQPELAVPGGWLYPAGVSLYSTALVACPAFLARFARPEKSQPVAWSAAVLYSIAGWFGSANGIGMAENLQRIPVAFLIIAGGVFFIPVIWPIFKKRRVESIVGVAVLSSIAAVQLSSPATPAGSSSMGRGRSVYLAEGCINCHSRYVRPDSPDVEKWGPVVPLNEVLAGAPVLIGNRRSGPDLLNVGNRRSRAWLKQHFLDPQSLSEGSVMPSYRHLFDDDRGEALLDFLMARGQETFARRLEIRSQWKPNPQGSIGGNSGATLFTSHCASCHGAEGQGNGPLANLWVRPPANLVAGPFAHSLNPAEIERIIKFGIMGTDMPGHENLTDDEVVALAEFVRGLR